MEPEDFESNRVTTLAIRLNDLNSTMVSFQGHDSFKTDWCYEFFKNDKSLMDTVEHMFDKSLDQMMGS